MDHLPKILCLNNVIGRFVNQIIDVSPNERNSTFYKNPKERKDYLQKVSIDDCVISGGAWIPKQIDSGKLQNRKNSEQQNINYYVQDRYEYGLNFHK